MISKYECSLDGSRLPRMPDLRGYLNLTAVAGIILLLVIILSVILEDAGNLGHFSDL